MKFSKCAIAFAVGMLCLSLTGCEKTLKLREQSAEIDAKISALNQEKNSLDAQLTSIRPTMPQAGSNDEAARILYSRAAGELTVLEGSLKTAATGVKETEAAIAALKQEIAAQKGQ